MGKKSVARKATTSRLVTELSRAPALLAPLAGFFLLSPGQALLWLPAIASLLGHRAPPGGGDKNVGLLIP